MTAETGLSARRRFWISYQPGFRASGAPVGSPAFFAEVEARRYELEPHIAELAQFERWAGSDVLEVGCGIATDGMRFVRAGARYTGIDFSDTALELARHRVELEGASARFLHGSAAQLPVPDGSFDLVYSNGVIHHIPETGQAIREIRRVLRPGGPSKAYTAAGMRRAFSGFATVDTEIRFLNLRAYPLGERLERLRTVRRLGRRWGWHLWIRATA